MSKIKLLLVKIRPAFQIFEIVLIPLVIITSVWLRIVKFLGLKNFWLTKKALLKLGVFPIVNHYYEPKFDYSNFKFSQEPRKLDTIDFREKEQLSLIRQFNFQDELLKFPNKEEKELTYYYDNKSFGPGDGELYYSLIRLLKPKRIIEVGSGFSTRIALAAINKNKDANNHHGSISCIEPYEMPWLSQIDVEVIRKPVETVELEFFQNLEANDILFIDSSHIVRPGGDVLYEILHILPTLKKGVYVHFHDIFSPFEYPENWLVKEFRMWNEQYILESFLSYNSAFHIVASLAHLSEKYKEEVKTAFPVLGQKMGPKPGSFWIQKVI